MDLKQFILTRTIGCPENLLKRSIGGFDVIEALKDLGYNNFASYHELNPLSCGAVINLDETLHKATLGIPSNARVRVQRLGRKGEHLLVTFDY